MKRSPTSCRAVWLKMLAAAFVCTVVVARSSMSTCLVYEARLPGKVYVGCTQLALTERLRAMKAKPVHWLRTEDSLARLKELTPLHRRRVPEATALAL